MKALRRSLVVLVLLQGLPGCGGSSSPSAPSVPSAVPQAPSLPTIPHVTGFILDSADRAIAGAVVEVLDGPQSGTSTVSDAAGAFSLTGTFDGTTRFRASHEGHVSATQAFSTIVRGFPVRFRLAVLAAPVNVAGDYTLTFTADSACADQLPAEVRTRTYAATITPLSSATQPANTLFMATLSGADLDTYYRMIAISVAGDYVDFDLSDNVILEEVAPETYLMIGGIGAADGATSGASTISATFHGLMDYCVTTEERDAGSVYTCVQSRAIAHAQCSSKNHRLTLTRR